MIEVLSMMAAVAIMGSPLDWPILAWILHYYFNDVEGCCERYWRFLKATLQLSQGFNSTIMWIEGQNMQKHNPTEEVGSEESVIRSYSRRRCEG